LCLRSLTSGSRFNIVSFGNSFEPLFAKSRPYDDASMNAAATFVATLDADMGGTELLPALQHVVSQEPVAGLARQVLVLTDGEVTNTDEVIELARRHAATARFFTFGIGAGASQHLVRGIARASGGAAEFISPGERIEAKVMRQFKRVFAPALTDVKVEWGQPGVTPASDRVPPVFDGERMAVYALIDGPQNAIATLSGTLAGRAVSFEISVDPERAVQGDTIATLAARQRIRTLEEQGEYLESRGSRQRRARANTGAAAEIAALGVKYQLSSRETSFVAIEHRETPVKDRAELRRVPVALTSGWGGVQHAPFHLGQLQASAAAGTMHASYVMGLPPSSSADAYFEAASGPFDAEAAAPTLSRFSVASHVVRSKAHRQALRPHDQLVALQRADGSWELDAAFAQAVSMKLRDLEKALRNATGDTDIVRRALATAVAIAYLETFAPGARGEWEMLAEKARRWLAACGAESADGESWSDLAARIVR
jgi:hypothetical protein